MTTSPSQFVVIFAPRAGEEQQALPARLSELTGKSRTQVSIELQRGEVELLRTSSTEEVAQMVAKAAAAGLLAVVRDTADAGIASGGAAEGWGRVLGAFDAKVAVAPATEQPGREPARSAVDDWSRPGALRLGQRTESDADDTGGSTPRQPASQAPIAPMLSPDLLDAAADQVWRSATSPRRRPPTAKAVQPRLPMRAGLVLLVLALLVGLGFATFRKLNQAVGASAATPDMPQRDAIEVAPAPAAEPGATDTAEQVRLLVGRANDACRSADFQRCKSLADQALDLDETNRAAQAVHIKAVTAISASAGKPNSPPVPP